MAVVLALGVGMGAAACIGERADDSKPRTPRGDGLVTRIAHDTAALDGGEALEAGADGSSPVTSPIR